MTAYVDTSALLRLVLREPGAETGIRRRAMTDRLEALDLVLLRPAVLSRASEPLPTPLGTLDAIHLASALIWRERRGEVAVLATHDGALGLVARSFGFNVQGV